MANTYLLNQGVGSGSTAMIGLKSQLKAMGWTVIGSGDGTSSFNLSGTDVCATFVSANNGPWVVLQMPNSTRQICICKKSDGGGTSRAYRIKYSPRLGFVDGPRANGVVVGSVSATNPPSAADERLLLFNSASNDDTATSSGATMFPSDNTHLWQVMTQNAAPYGFWMIGYVTTNPTTRTDYVFFLDPVTAVDPLDVDPYVWYATDIGSNLTNTPLRSTGMFGLASGAATSPYTLWRDGLTNVTWAKCCAPSLLVGAGNVRAIPAAIGQNIYDNGDDSLPLLYLGQRVAQGAVLGAVSYKGYSSLFRWKGSAWPNLRTLIASTPNDRIIFDDVVADWDGLTIPRLA